MRCRRRGDLWDKKTEANDRVWSLKQETQKALETLAILHELVEQVTCDLSDVDKKINKKFEEMEKTKEAQKFAEIAVQTASRFM